MSAGSWTFSSKRGGFDNKSGSRGPIGTRVNEYENIKEDSLNTRLVTIISPGDRSHDFDKADAYPMHAIAVNHEVNVV